MLCKQPDGLGFLWYWLGVLAEHRLSQTSFDLFQAHIMSLNRTYGSLTSRAKHKCNSDACDHFNWLNNFQNVISATWLFMNISIHSLALKYEDIKKNWDYSCWRWQRQAKLRHHKKYMVWLNTKNNNLWLIMTSFIKTIWWHQQISLGNQQINISSIPI